MPRASADVIRSKNILQDPVVLSCTHKFCRQCLSDVCGPRKSSSCPVCEKKFDALDPANYRVDNILDQFVQVHFRPQTQKPQPQHELTRSDSFMFRVRLFARAPLPCRC